MAYIRREADIQKRRPKRPPKLNGGALHLGRIGAHTGGKKAHHRNQRSVTEFRESDAFAQHKIALTGALTRIFASLRPNHHSGPLQQLVKLRTERFDFALLSQFPLDKQFGRWLAPHRHDQHAQHRQPASDAHAHVEMVIRDENAQPDRRERRHQGQWREQIRLIAIDKMVIDGMCAD